MPIQLLKTCIGYKQRTISLFGNFIMIWWFYFLANVSYPHLWYDNNGDVGSDEKCLFFFRPKKKYEKKTCIVYVYSFFEPRDMQNC